MASTPQGYVNQMKTISVKLQSSSKPTEEECGCNDLYPLTFTQKKTLQKYNYVGGFLHLVAALSFLIVSANFWGEGRAFKGINTATYLSKPNFIPKVVGEQVSSSEPEICSGTGSLPEECDQEENSGSSANSNTRRYIIGSVSSQLVSENDEYVLPVLTVLFSSITAIFHFLLASKNFSYINSSKYYSGISNGTNVFRWLEYSITASIMLVIVCFTLGLRDFTGVIGVVSTNFLIMIMGAAIEYFIANKQKGPAVGLTVAAWIAYAALWFSIWFAFKQAIDALTEVRKSQALSSSQKDEFDEFEVFIYMATLSIFLLFSAFGANQAFWLYKQFPWGSTENGKPGYDPYKSEKIYVLLSALSKFVLVGLLFWGLYFRSSNLN